MTTPPPDPRNDTATAQPLHVAIDIGPLYGHRTGIGVAVAGLSEAMGRRTDVVLDPYLVSYRSTPGSGHSRLPVPGIVASHVWSRTSRLTADRWLGAADVLHGTNYVAPPSRKPTVVSVYDCWFLANPHDATPLVRRAGATLRRRVAEGAWVHASSDATAIQATELLATDRVRTIFLGPPSLVDESAEQRPDQLTGVEGRPFIVCVGTEERRKGVPLLVDAFSHLAGDHPDLQLVLVGATGDDTPAVSAAVDRIGAPIVDSVIKWYGESPNDWRATRERIRLAYDDDPEWWASRVNFASTIMALLYGDGDLIDTVTLAGLAGWDADNNMTTAAGLLGAISGFDALPEPFASASDVYFNEDLTGDLPRLDSVSNIATRTADLGLQADD